MPGGDRTGPMGEGPRTGRAAGFCARFGVPGYMNPNYNAGRSGFGMGRGAGYGRGFGFGRGAGFGRGFGAGRGWRHRFNAAQPGWGWNQPPYGEANAATAAPVRPSADNELADLKEQARYFSDTLKEINQRIAELEKRQDG